MTQSMFVAEGGVLGEIDILPRGSVIPAGSSASKPVTTGSKTSRPVTTTSGSIGAPGGGVVGAVVSGVLTAAFVLSVPLIKQWFAKNYLQEKWTAEAQAMVMKAIEGSVYRYNILILSRLQDIQREKAAGRQIRLRIDVDTEWVDTDFGPAQTKADVSYYSLLSEGDIDMEWPLFRKEYGFWSQLFRAARITYRRSTFYFVL